MRRAWLVVLLATTAGRAGAGPDFDREVRPILSRACFNCHGPDEQRRAGGLRLDTFAGATAAAASGRRAVAPGQPAGSELLRRVGLAGEGQMPPAGERLSAAQVDVLQRWIAAGAGYQRHWAFDPPRPIQPPALRDPWVRNPVDAFVLQRLRRAALPPSPTADRATLLRRLALDLTGLPPSLAEVREFVADRRPDAYERQVDRLLASTHFGERLALEWLDLARYADTHGYHIDSHRDMWLWRDWVIDAFNRNVPYDQFVIEQLAGDLLPEATVAQRIATGFNRNHPINYEGGAIPEEYLNAYVNDRVDTTATTFLGLTLRCAMCHDHKYDPISQREYYQFYAYFNNVAEQGLDGRTGNAAPLLPVPTAEQAAQQGRLAARRQELSEQLAARRAATTAAQEEWVKAAAARLGEPPELATGLVWHGDFEQGLAGLQTVGSGHGSGPGRWGLGLTLSPAGYLNLGDRAGFERDQPCSYGGWVKSADGNGAVLARMDDATGIRGWDLFLGGRRVFVHLIHTWPENAIRLQTADLLPTDRWTHLLVTYDGSSRASGVKLYVDGALAKTEVTHDTLSGTIRVPQPLHVGRRNPSAAFSGSLDDLRIYDRVLLPAEVDQLAGFAAVRDLLLQPAAERTAEGVAKLGLYYLETRDAPYRELRIADEALVREQQQLEAAIPTTMVMRELDERRVTHLLQRGQYDQPGDEVQPGVPAALPPLPRKAPRNRLALARWLVAPEHPLTARVQVNRLWQYLFGSGLVATSEDFGTQGERPTHPELLDWLAGEFVRSGWDQKALLRLLVTSQTYRQVAVTRAEHLAKDPTNRLLSRFPRRRLKAELVRDQALAVAGLLNPAVGGPSVRPYQPPDLWKDVSFNPAAFTAQVYEQDHGPALYRRSLYFFWKRSAPPTLLNLLDAPEREYCVVRRSSTNTPLQALALLNEPGLVEAARKLGERAQAAAGSDDGRLAWLWQITLARAPRPPELALLRRLLAAERRDWAGRPQDAAALLAVGEAAPAAGVAPTELASWTMLATCVLNLDETVTRS